MTPAFKNFAFQVTLLSAESGDEEHYEDGVTSVSSINHTCACLQSVCMQHTSFFHTVDHHETHNES